MNRLDIKLAVIRNQVDEILSSTTLLEGISKRTNELITPKFDLRRSANALREAAAKLDSICDRSKDHAVQEG